MNTKDNTRSPRSRGGRKLYPWNNYREFAVGGRRRGLRPPEPPLQLREGRDLEPIPVFERNRNKSKPFNHKGFPLSNLAKNFVVKRF